MAVVVSAGIHRYPVDLGMAGNFVILAKTGISAVPTCTIIGDIAVCPIDRSGLTGWSEIVDPSNVFSTSAQVNGKLFAADYALPTSFILVKAVNNMKTAYDDAARRTNPDFTELGAGDISGLTLAPALYKWSNTVVIKGNVTLHGGPNDVWIFQVAGGLSQASATRIVLAGGARAKNIFWQSAGVVALGTSAHLKGIVLGATGITLNTGATVNGRLLSQTAVTLIMNTVTAP